MPIAQMRPAQRIDFVDPERSGTYNSPGSSLDLPIPTILVSNDRMDTVLINDVGLSAARVSQFTINDKQHAILEFVRGGGLVALPLPAHVETTTSPTNQVDAYGTVWLNTTTQQVYQTPGDGTWTLLIDFA